jgi:PleD family two-component response regulator
LTDATPPVLHAEEDYDAQLYSTKGGRRKNVAKVGILIVDDDEANQSALRQVLDSEDWRVQGVRTGSQGLAQLSTGEWSLVIANAALVGTETLLFVTLRELALAPAVEAGTVRARALFVVPDSAVGATLAALERDRLPYLLKPFQFHDLLEKVSDLLMEAAALENPIRRVRHDSSAAERKRKETRKGRESGNRQYRRDTNMFARRDEYVMSEEELAEYEKSELEAEELRKKKKRLIDGY